MICVCGREFIPEKNQKYCQPEHWKIAHGITPRTHRLAEPTARQIQAIDLFRDLGTYKAVAERMGISPDGAWKLVREGEERIRDMRVAQ